MSEELFYLIDVNEEKNIKKYKRQMMVCDAFARTLLFCDFGKSKDRIEKCMCFWSFNETKRYKYETLKLIDSSSILWYIKNKITVQDEIWNGSFLHGLANYGSINNITKTVRQFSWWSNEEVFHTLDQSPFGGTLSNRFLIAHRARGKSMHRKFRYSSYAYYLPYKEYSPSYVAGIMAGGKIIQENGYSYAQYPKRVRSIFEFMKIPIEKVNKLKQLKSSFFVSPFWPALFESLMPEKSRIYSSVPKAYMADSYAAVLWKIYTTCDFVTGAIPYLPSRRWIYYNYKTDDEAVIKFLERKYVDWKLVELHNVFRERILLIADKIKMV